MYRPAAAIIFLSFLLTGCTTIPGPPVATPALTQTVLSSSATAAIYGSSVTLTAQVVSNGGTPSGGTFAVTIEPVSGGPVYGARMIRRKSGSSLGFTIQDLTDDHSTVQIPRVVQDGSVVLP